MAISNGVITVAATATAVFTGDSDGAHVLVHNAAASVV
jgi:hypothetical protein